MNIIGLILAVLSFIGGQVYLFFCLRRLNQLLKRGSSDEPTSTYDDSCRYPDEDVIE